MLALSIDHQFNHLSLSSCYEWYVNHHSTSSFKLDRLILLSNIRTTSDLQLLDVMASSTTIGLFNHEHRGSPQNILRSRLERVFTDNDSAWLQGYRTTQDLWNILLHLGKHSPRSPIGFDALCINQDNAGGGRKNRRSRMVAKKILTSKERRTYALLIQTPPTYNRVYNIDREKDHNQRYHNGQKYFF